MSVEAMKQALEALRCIESPLHVWEINKLAGAMNALCQAIEFEEMVKKGTKAWADTPDDWVDDLRGGVEKQEPVGYLYDWLNPDNQEEVIRDWFAASMYVIEKDKGFNVRPLYTAPVHASDMSQERVDETAKDQLVPDGMIPISNGGIATSTPTDFFAPPKREWVGLTDEDIDLYAFDEGVTDNKAPAWLVTYARGIEAKLKEKNT